MTESELWHSEEDPGAALSARVRSRFEAESPVAEEEAAEAPREAEDSREERNECWPGDCGTMSLPLRKVLVTLLKGPYLYREKRRDAWNLLMDNLPAARSQLANLLLEIVVDEELGVAFVKKPEIEDEQVPSLLNRYAFRFLDSVLLVEMRDRLMRAQQSGQRAIMEADEISAHLAVFDPISKTDQKVFAQHVSAVLKRMKERHLLLDLGRGSSAWEISPVLKVVFDASQVDALREAYSLAVERMAAAQELVGEAGAAAPEDEAPAETEPQELRLDI